MEVWVVFNYTASTYIFAGLYDSVEAAMRACIQTYLTQKNGATITWTPAFLNGASLPYPQAPATQTIGGQVTGTASNADKLIIQRFNTANDIARLFNY